MHCSILATGLQSVLEQIWAMSCNERGKKAGWLILLRHVHAVQCLHQTIHKDLGRCGASLEPGIQAAIASDRGFSEHSNISRLCRHRTSMTILGSEEALAGLVPPSASVVGAHRPYICSRAMPLLPWRPSTRPLTMKPPLTLPSAVSGRPSRTAAATTCLAHSRTHAYR